LDTGFKRTTVVDWLEADDVPYQAHLHAPVYNARKASAIGLPFDVSLLLKTRRSIANSCNSGGCRYRRYGGFGNAGHLLWRRPPEHHD
jgi:hypothetical protein